MFYEIKEITDAILRDYAIDGILKDSDDSLANVVDDELIFQIHFNNKTLNHCVSVDNRKCYNKASQCPVHFCLEDLSRRKKNRLHQALTYLRTPEGERVSATFDWNGWDEFGHHVRDEFYQK